MRKPRNKTFASLARLLRKEIASAPISENSRKYSRRKFIEQSSKGLVGAAIMINAPQLFTSCKSGPNIDYSDVLDVAILGAGISGLNCANHLLDSGLNFRIFEASYRTGGRILTHYNNAFGLGVSPEFGGDFIDSDHADMLALAKEFKLDLIDLIAEQEAGGYEREVYFFDNRKISEEEIIEEFKKIASKIASDINALGEDYDTERAVDLDNTPLSEYIENLDCVPWFKDLLNTAFLGEYGIECREQSTINMLDMLNPDTSEGFEIFGGSDEQYRIKGGNSKIIESLVDKIGRDMISFNSEVESISEDQDGFYIIHFKNQETAKAWKIVCTIPFKILRDIPLRIKGMSPEKKKCIDELGFGENTKILLGYKDQPWRDNNAMGYMFHSKITMGWDNSYNKLEGNPNSIFVCYFGGDYSKKLNSQSSKNKMAPPTHVWRTELPEDVVQGHVEDLDDLYTGSKEKFLGKHVYVNWLEYPYTKGSYSCYKVGQWTTIAGLEMESVGNFHFAGEHCSEMFQGFMNGGAETGRRAAEMILKEA